MVIAVISLILSVLAILISLRAERDTRRQTKIMEGQEARKLREDQGTEDWSKKFDEAVRELLAIEPKAFNDSRGRAFLYIFPDGALRQRIETYLINADLGRNHFTARSVNGEMLRLQIVQQTIQQVLNGLRDFRENDPTSAGQLGLSKSHQQPL